MNVRHLWLIAYFSGFLHYNSSPSVPTNFSTSILTDRKLAPEVIRPSLNDTKPTDSLHDNEGPTITILDNQTCPDSSEDFPHLFSEEDLRSWAIIPVILVGIYCFTILAIICDKYFLPCMEVLCEVFNLTQVSEWNKA